MTDPLVRAGGRTRMLSWPIRFTCAGVKEPVLLQTWQYYRRSIGRPLGWMWWALRGRSVRASLGPWWWTRPDARPCTKEFPPRP